MVFARVRLALTKLRAQAQMLRARKKRSPQHGACAAAKMVRRRMASAKGARGQHTLRKARQELLRGKNLARTKTFSRLCKDVLQTVGGLEKRLHPDAILALHVGAKALLEDKGHA